MFVATSFCVTVRKTSSLRVPLEESLRVQGLPTAQFPIGGLAPTLVLLTPLGSCPQRLTSLSACPGNSCLGRESVQLLPWYALSSQETQHSSFRQASCMPLIFFPFAISVQFTFLCLGGWRVAKQTSNCERCYLLFLRYPQFLLKILLKPSSLDFIENKPLSSSL